jgi:hypothetical protein
VELLRAAGRGAPVSLSRWSDSRASMGASNRDATAELSTIPIRISVPGNESGATGSATTETYSIALPGWVDRLAAGFVPGSLSSGGGWMGSSAPLTGAGSVGSVDPPAGSVGSVDPPAGSVGSVDPPAGSVGSVDPPPPSAGVWAGSSAPATGGVVSAGKPLPSSVASGADGGLGSAGVGTFTTGSWSSPPGSSRGPPEAWATPARLRAAITTATEMATRPSAAITPRLGRLRGTRDGKLAAPLWLPVFGCRTTSGATRCRRLASSMRLSSPIGGSVR